MRALDLFCGAGGASMGLAMAGFLVDGVDIREQPNYPFNFRKADALTFPLEGYDFIWASPPCQAHTKAQKIQGREHPNLIPAIRRRLQAAGVPYCIENVPGAPLKNPVLLCGAMFGLKVYRHRIFEANFEIPFLLHSHSKQQVKMGRPVSEGDIIQVVGNFTNAAYARKAMGINWMSRNELSEAIPPAYSQFIAQAALRSELRYLKDAYQREIEASAGAAI